MEINDKSAENHQQQQQRFPITKPQMCGNNPKFPYRDIRHYTEPCCDFPKQCQVGYTAQITLNQMTNSPTKCHSPEFPPSHPWFEPAPGTH